MNHLEYVDSLEDCIKEWVPDGEGQNELMGFVDGLRRRFIEIVDQCGLWIAQDAPPDACPICGGGLRVDEEYMQDTFGPAWTEMPWPDWSFWCEACEEAGLWAEFVDLSGMEMSGG